MIYNKNMKKDFFGRRVVVVVFYDEKGNVLLQNRKRISKRGEEWGFYGGGIEKGETFEATFKRELKEELGYQTNDFKYIGDCANKLDDGYIVDRKVFITKIPENISELKDGEGDGYKTFSINKAKKLKLVPGDTKVLDMLEDYLIK